MKKAKAVRLPVFNIACPECGELIESCSNNGTASTMYTEVEWHRIPEVLTCQECGAKVARPNDPFKKATSRKSTTSMSGYRDFPREEEYRDEHDSLVRPGY